MTDQAFGIKVANNSFINERYAYNIQIIIYLVRTDIGSPFEISIIGKKQ